MISAFVVTSQSADDPSLRIDLDAVGVAVLGEGTSRSLVQEVIRSAPDVVICYEKHPDEALFASMEMLGTSAPRPVILFTIDPDADKIDRAMRSGVHAYIINGYSPQRLRAMIHVAQARFRHDRALRQELIEVNARFDERKLVDRAKGILMRARQISEDEAFRALRTAAMQTKQRLGQVAQQVINAALYSDGVNRAGMLRMLSQQIVKFYAAQAAALDTEKAAASMAAAADRADDNIATLRRTLSKATFGDLIDSVATPWLKLKAALKIEAAPNRLVEVDDCADALLQMAERLTSNLATAGLATTLRVINVAGRQRMLVQRMAKLALLMALLEPGPAARMQVQGDATVAAFREGLDYLKTVPLSTEAIREDLAHAETLWLEFQAALSRTGTRQGQRDVVDVSESLVQRFDRLVELYERSMEMLMA